MDFLSLIIFLVLLVVMFYFLIIRPQRKRQQEQQSLIANLKPGDRVITIGGIHGEVTQVDSESVVLKIESGALLRMAKNGIASKQS